MDEEGSRDSSDIGNFLDSGGGRAGVGVGLFKLAKKQSDRPTEDSWGMHLLQGTAVNASARGGMLGLPKVQAKWLSVINA